jgi:predicted Zn-dependent protease with MMP-like domain
MVYLSREEFEAAVADALDAMPADLMRQLDNVAFFVEDEPAPGEPELLGLYEGVALTERDNGWGMVNLNLPDRIVLFRGPLMRLCADREELLTEIQVTVVHEIAHHFGIDDDRLHDLGWG